MGDALHHAAVAQDAVGVVVDHREAFAVELGGQMLFRHGHADRICDALTQRAGGGFNADGVAILRMAGGLGAKLAELLEVLNGQAVSEQVQKAVHQHGAVAGGEHEAVAVGPLGIGGVVLHLLAPNGIGGRCGAHGHSGMAGIRLLNCLSGKDADGIDDQLFMIHGNASPVCVL